MRQRRRGARGSALQRRRAGEAVDVPREALVQAAREAVAGLVAEELAGVPDVGERMAHVARAERALNRLRLDGKKRGEDLEQAGERGTLTDRDVVSPVERARLLGERGE